MNTSSMPPTPDNKEKVTKISLSDIEWQVEKLIMDAQVEKLRNEEEFHRVAAPLTLIRTALSMAAQTEPLSKKTMDDGSMFEFYILSAEADDPTPREETLDVTYGPSGITVEHSIGNGGNYRQESVLELKPSPTYKNALEASFTCHMSTGSNTMPTIPLASYSTEYLAM